MVNYEELESRMDRLIVLGKNDLSMAMVIDMISGIARSYGIPEKEAIAIYNTRFTAIDLDASSVIFDMVEGL